MTLPRLHPSSWESWTGCGKRFELEVVRGKPPESRHPATVNGTAIHAVIDAIHRESLWDIPDSDLGVRYRAAFEQAIERPLHHAELDIPVAWGGDEADVKAALGLDAMAMLLGYRRDPRNREAVLVASEARWRATFGGFDWEGTLDQARRLDGGIVEVVDFKSGRECRAPVPMQMWLQGLTYALALEHAVFQPISAPEHAAWSPKQLPVGRVTWAHLRDYIPYKRRGKRSDGSAYEKGDTRGPVFRSVDITPAALDSAMKELAMFSKAVAAGRFERRPSNYQCSRCGVAELCLMDFNSSLDVASLVDRATEDGEYGD